MVRVKTFVSILLLVSSYNTVPTNTLESSIKDSIISVKYIDSIIRGISNYNIPDSERKHFLILEDSIKEFVFSGKNLKNKKRDSLIFEALNAYADYCGHVRYSPNYLPRAKGAPYDTNWYVYTNQFPGGDDSLLSFFTSHCRHEVQIPESYFDSIGQYNLTLKFLVGRKKKVSEISISKNSNKEYFPFTQEISRLCYMLRCWNSRAYYVDNNYKSIKQELIEMRYCYLLSINKNGEMKLKLVDKEKSN